MLRCVRILLGTILLFVPVGCQDNENSRRPNPGNGAIGYSASQTRLGTPTGRLCEGAPSVSYQASPPWAGPSAPTTLLFPQKSVEQVYFPSGDHRLRAWFNRHGESEKRPAVLFLHGGWAFGVDDWEMTQPFRDAGYVVLTPILRGENGQPGSFTMFYDEVDDVLAAADYLAKVPCVDPNRIYIAGHSAVRDVDDAGRDGIESLPGRSFILWFVRSNSVHPFRLSKRRAF